MKVKSSGTSRTARFTVGNRRTGQLETVDLRGVTALRRERQRAAGEIEQHIQGFSRETRRMIAEIRDEPFIDEGNNTALSGQNDMEWESCDTFDDNEIVDGMREMFKRYRYGWTRSSQRTWRDRRERAWLNWKPQLPDLCKAYMAWKYSDTTSAPSSRRPPTLQILLNPSIPLISNLQRSGGKWVPWNDTRLTQSRNIIQNLGIIPAPSLAEGVTQCGGIRKGHVRLLQHSLPAPVSHRTR
ncbi:hypothetical protein AB1N83_008626 [Pleurotus pulmonarius]